MTRTVRIEIGVASERRAPNENKMSDGGRGGASLGVEGWKSSQEWSARRSAVRSIAWLGVDVASEHAWNENSEDERRGFTSDDRTRNLLWTQAIIPRVERKELGAGASNPAAARRSRTAAGAENALRTTEKCCDRNLRESSMTASEML